LEKSVNARVLEQCPGLNGRRYRQASVYRNEVGNSEVQVMPRSEVNVIVDVRHPLKDELRDELVDAIVRLQGVHRASVSAVAPRVVLVDYDPKQIDTQRILGTVVRRGFDARLVGM
jgi:hypothetical protein